MKSCYALSRSGQYYHREKPANLIKSLSIQPDTKMPVSCPSCDDYALTDTINNTLTCSSCQHQIPANLPPLFLISSASGTGKSTLVRRLRPLLPECLVVGGDLLVDTA